MRRIMASVLALGAVMSVGSAPVQATGFNCEGAYALDLAICDGSRLCEAIAYDTYVSCVHMREVTGGFGDGS